MVDGGSQSVGNNSKPKKKNRKTDEYRRIGAKIAWCKANLVHLSSWLTMNVILWSLSRRKPLEFSKTIRVCSFYFRRDKTVLRRDLEMSDQDLSKSVCFRHNISLARASCFQVPNSFYFGVAAGTIFLFALISPSLVLRARECRIMFSFSLVASAIPSRLCVHQAHECRISSTKQNSPKMNNQAKR